MKADIITIKDKNGDISHIRNIKPPKINGAWRDIEDHKDIVEKINQNPLDKLKQEIPYKWRVQSFSKLKPQAQCVAYIDSRDVQNLLDEVIGAENWQDDYKEVKRNVYAGIGIKISDEWIWKWDCGTESNMEAEKGEASDSFKRAGVKWGIGRFLYNLDIQYVKTNEVNTGNNYPYCVDNSGNRIWDLTAHINSTGKSIPKMEKGLDDARKRKEIASFLNKDGKLKSKEEYEEVSLSTFGIELKPENYDTILEMINL